MRDNWLSNRIFKSYDDPVDHCCAAWNKLVDQPWRIMRAARGRMRVVAKFARDGKGPDECRRLLGFVSPAAGPTVSPKIFHG
jgi:hypothetical protein